MSHPISDFSFYLSLSLSLSHTHKHTHTCTMHTILFLLSFTPQTLTQFLSHIRLSHSLEHTLFHINTHTHTHPVSKTHSHPVSNFNPNPKLPMVVYQPIDFNYRKFWAEDSTLWIMLGQEMFVLRQKEKEKIQKIVNSINKTDDFNFVCILLIFLKYLTYNIV